MNSDSAITKQQPTQMQQASDPMQILAEMARRSEDPTVAVAVAKSIVDLQQSSERFQWEREGRQAKIDFDNALNHCQSQVERIAPNRERENSIMWLDYAGLNKVVRPIYLEVGFSIGFSEVESPTEGRRMCATLSRSGVSREYFSKLIPSGNGKMSAADLDASGSSRAMRYLLLKIFNIAVAIDKDEKKPFEGDRAPGELDERTQIEHLENIRNANNGAELQRLYLAAKKWADLGEFERAKNERIKTLRAEGRF